MTENRQVVGLVISVLEEPGGQWGVLVVDDGQGVPLPVPCDVDTIAGQPDTVESLLGRRIRYDGSKVECLDKQPAEGQFDLGQLSATLAALVAIAASQQAPADFIARHAAGDWGDLDDDAKQRNEAALLDGSRLHSVFYTAKGVKLYTVTSGTDDDGRRPETVVLLAHEYSADC